MHYMEIGGAERALLGLLNAIDTEKYEVDLFINQHTGEFMPLIPKRVNLLPAVPAYTAIERPMKTVLREGHFRVVAARLWARVTHWFYARRLPADKRQCDASLLQYVMNAAMRVLPSLEQLGEYDLAISFLTPHNLVLDKVKAKRKVAWIHTDYTKIFVNAAQELKVWSRYDHIVSISPAVSRTFLQCFPSLEGKIVQMENILSPRFVREQAALTDVESEMPRPAGGIRLLTIGRYSPPKNFDNLPFICREIIKCGVAVRWYIMGYGGSDAYIREQIRAAGVEGSVVLLGKRANPYPYIKACDVYVQPSRYEGKAVTVREAQVLCKPVVITAFPTADSQLTNGQDGLIVPMDNEAAGKAIAAFLKNTSLQQQFIQYEQQHDYGNESEAQKLADFLR